jgi:hypothetical protein
MREDCLDSQRVQLAHERHKIEVEFVRQFQQEVTTAIRQRQNFPLPHAPNQIVFHPHVGSRQHNSFVPFRRKNCCSSAVRDLMSAGEFWAKLPN